MKTIKLVTIVLLTLINATPVVSQISVTPVTVGVYVNGFNKDTKGASNIGGGITLSFNKFYMDFAGNFASGKGEFLEFNSQYTYPADKINVVVFNAGYIISIKSFFIVPFLGVGISSEIYQDPVGWDTYYMGDRESTISIGLIGCVNLSPHIRLQAGVGNFEKFKAGLAYVWE